MREVEQLQYQVDGKTHAQVINANVPISERGEVLSVPDGHVVALQRGVLREILYDKRNVPVKTNYYECIFMAEGDHSPVRARVGRLIHSIENSEPEPKPEDYPPQLMTEEQADPIAGKLDELADLVEVWKRHREAGRTPNAVRSGIMMLVGEIEAMAKNG